MQKSLCVPYFFPPFHVLPRLFSFSPVLSRSFSFRFADSFLHRFFLSRSHIPPFSLACVPFLCAFFRRPPSPLLPYPRADKEEDFPPLRRPPTCAPKKPYNRPRRLITHFRPPARVTIPIIFAQNTLLKGILAQYPKTRA